MAAYICTSSDRWRHPQERKREREEGRGMKRRIEEASIGMEESITCNNEAISKASS